MTRVGADGEGVYEFILNEALAGRGWTLVIDGRDPVALAEAAGPLADRTTVRAVAGDVADPAHRLALIEREPELSAFLRSHFDGPRIVEGDAARLPKLLAEQGIGQGDDLALAPRSVQLS